MQDVSIRTKDRLNRPISKRPIGDILHLPARVRYGVGIPCCLAKNREILEVVGKIVVTIEDLPVDLLVTTQDAH